MELNTFIKYARMIFGVLLSIPSNWHVFPRKWNRNKIGVFDSLWPILNDSLNSEFNIETYVCD